MQKYTVKPGNLATLQLESFDLQPPAAEEVRVAVRAVGLNFADIFAIWGLYKAAPKSLFTPGLEYAGVVEAVGEGVKDLRVGQKVMGVTRFGGYASHLNSDARYVLPLPEDWDYATGAAYPVQTLTAYYGMKNLGNLQQGTTVLIHSAVGGVGLQALRIAQAYKCFTIGTVGSLSKSEIGLREGYDRMIVRGADFEQRLEEALEGRPLELVMDSVGGRYFTIPYDMLAPMGRIVVFGSARYTTVGDKPNILHMLRHWLTRPKIDPQSLPNKNAGILGFNLIWLYERAPLMHQLLGELAELRLPPPHVGHRYRFEDAREAIRMFQTGKTVGKVVLELGENSG
jgi:NADPH:quinone reductase-like Zn-dependent oxidoreductase